METPDAEYVDVEDVESLRRANSESLEHYSRDQEHDIITFDRSLAGKHTYLGEIDDVGGNSSYTAKIHEDGTILTIPVFFLEGVVLFPDKILPLRVLQPRFKAAVERAMVQGKTIGVSHVREKSDGPGVQVFVTGTTAEIRQLRHLPDGSMNVVTRGCQRFRLCRAWTEVDGAPCAEVRIIQSSKPPRIPREAFGILASVPRIHSGNARKLTCEHSDSSSSSFVWQSASQAWAADERNWLRRGQRSYWPHWVYRMFDAYDLARRAADIWKQTVGMSCVDSMLNDPETLSFFLASEMPLSDAVRQELLEVDIVSARLKREIEILETSDRINCKSCRDIIARRTDLLVMSTDGPVSTFVNPYGYVYETLTLWKAHVHLEGEPETKDSWFPGYSWTLCYCRCGMHMGWYFQALKDDIHPRAFWGIRRCQIAG